jgi:hypothetical protein
MSSDAAASMQSSLGLSLSIEQHNAMQRRSNPNQTKKIQAANDTEMTNDQDSTAQQLANYLSSQSQPRSDTSASPLTNTNLHQRFYDVRVM